DSDASLDCSRHQTRGAIEVHRLDDLVVLKADALPAADGAAFHHEQRHASSKTRPAFQKLPENLSLGTGFLNGSHGGAQNIGRGRTRDLRQRPKLGRGPAYNLHTQTGERGCEHFRNRPLDDGLYLLRTWHFYCAWPRLYGLLNPCQSARLLKFASLVS